MKYRVLSLILMVILAIISIGCSHASEIDDGKLVEAFLVDEAKAYSKYHGKELIVTGDVTDKLWNCIFLSQHPILVCLKYPDASDPRVLRAQQGDVLTAKGVCTWHPRGKCLRIDVGVTAEEFRKQNTHEPSPRQDTTTSSSSISSSVSTAPQVIKGRITGTEVRIRSGAGLNHSILGHFEKGELVTILEQTENWKRVKRSNGQVGWVSKDFCTIVY